MVDALPARRRRRGRADDSYDSQPAEADADTLDHPRTTYPEKRGRDRELADDDVKAIVRRMVDDARDYMQQDLAPVRERCWRYYNGQVDAVAKKGRSKAVDAVVRDTVDGMMPQLVRVFASSNAVARYDAENETTQDVADQATRFAQYVFEKQNQGFRQLHDHFKDGLVGGFGVLRAYCAHSSETTQERYEGLSPDEFALLMDDDKSDIEVLNYDQVTIQPAPPPLNAPPMPPPGPPPPQGGPPMMPPPGPPGGPPAPPPVAAGAVPGAGPPAPEGAPAGVGAGGPSNVVPFPGMLTQAPPQTEISVTIRRTYDRKRIVIDGVDPAEFIVDRRATDEEDAYCIGMDGLRSVSDLVAMGVDPDDLLDVPSAVDMDVTGEKRARQPLADPSGPSANPDDDSVDRSIQVVDVIVRVDQDGDGVAERRRILAVGPDFKILRNEPTDEVPYCVGSPILMPHSLIGQGVGELVADIQDIQTAILRQQMDSLYLAVNPRTIAVEQQVNLADLVDNQFNGIIRCRAPGMVQPYSVEFVGQQAFPMVERMDQIRENRTGLSRASQGLQADALQSSTEIGVRAVIGAALMKIELLARTYAETSIKRLFRTILWLAVRYQQEPMTIAVDGKTFDIDPRAWRTDMGVTVNVGLGTGNEDERKAALGMIMGKQEQIMQTIGPDNPLCDLIGYGNAIEDFMALTPYRDASRYFKKPTPDSIAAWQQQQAAQAKEAQAKDDTQAKMAKVQADAQAKGQKLQMDQQLNQQRLQLQQQQGQQKLQLQAQEGQQELMLDAQQAQATLELERQKALGQMQLDRERTAIETQTGIAELQAEAALTKYEIDVDAQTKKATAKTDTRLRKPNSGD